MEQNINDMSILEAALEYARRGFQVFPVHGMKDGKCTCGFPGCKAPNSGKHPATKNGLKDATTNEATIRAWFASSGWNVAIRTGAESRIWVLDVDGAQGEESLNTLEREHGKLPATLESTTGRGRHLIFKHTGEELKNSASKIGLKIDARGDGGYIVAPPSRHHSGVNYSLTERECVYAPDWIYDIARGEKRRESVEPQMPLADAPGRESDWEVADVRNMLDALDPDMDYMAWVRIGMAVHEGGFSITLWDEWSRRGKKYQAGDCIKRWRGFTAGDGVTMGTLVEAAQLAGWEPRRKEGDPIGAEIAARIHLDYMRKKQKIATIPHDFTPPAVIEKMIPFPPPMEVSGIIGDTVKWIVSTAIKPQPELALLHTIASLGAVFGRRYKCQGIYDTRPNLYMIGLAGSGSGKEHSRRQISTLMNGAGLGEFIGAGRFVSDAGLITALQKKPSQIMPIDEIGLVLQMISDKKAAGYLKNIATHLLTLYSSSGGFFNAGQYADKEKAEVVIAAPNLCIYGTTTRESYIRALTSDAVLDGQLNRFIAIPVSNEVPERNEDDSRETVPPHHLLTQWEALKFQPDISTNASFVSPSPKIVVWGKEIGLRFKNMGDLEDKKLRDNTHNLGRLWNRYRENVAKIAMIFAIARNQERPEIITGDLDVAEGIVMKSLEFMTQLCLEHVADSDFQRNCQKVLEFIKKKKEVTQTELYSYARFLKSKEIKEVLESLEEQAQIESRYESASPLAKKKTKIICAV